METYCEVHDRLRSNDWMGCVLSEKLGSITLVYGFLILSTILALLAMCFLYKIVSEK